MSGAIAAFLPGLLMAITALSWTTPAGVAPGHWWELESWDQTTTRVVTVQHLALAPGAQGAPQAVVVWHPDGAAVTYRVRACNPRAGCGEWSNPAVALRGARDTLYVCGFPARCRWGPEADWQLAVRDSLARVVSIEQIQRWSRPRLCELYGYWALAGAHQACP